MSVVTQIEDVLQELNDLYDSMDPTVADKGHLREMLGSLRDARYSLNLAMEEGTYEDGSYE